MSKTDAPNSTSRRILSRLISTKSHSITATKYLSTCLLGCVATVFLQEPFTEKLTQFSVALGLSDYKTTTNELASQMKSQTDQLTDRLSKLQNKMGDMAKLNTSAFGEFEQDFVEIIAELNAMKPNLDRVSKISERYGEAMLSQEEYELATYRMSDAYDFRFPRYSNTSLQVCEKGTTLFTENVYGTRYLNVRTSKGASRTYQKVGNEVKNTGNIFKATVTLRGLDDDFLYLDLLCDRISES